MTPHLCKAGIQLREQFDDAYPDRDRTSDGWLGDSRHQNTVSNHNPDAGVVRAIDIDRDLAGKSKPDIMPYVADQLRVLCKSGKEKRISYIIFNNRIASAKKGWAWRPYSGVNPHNHHMHVSFTKAADAMGEFFQIPMLGGKP
jgi:hypothetical protein